MLVLTGLATASTAAFVARTSSAPDRLGLGTVDISASPAGALLELEQLRPGTALHRPVRLVNQGSLPLRHSMRVFAEGGLDDAAVLRVVASAPSCDAAGFADGEAVYGPGPLGRADGMRVYGDVRRGQQPGDRVLPPGRAERLCFRVSVPARLAGAGPLRTRVRVVVDAEQTVHNP